MAAGEFPQPTSPWESRGLLYAEVVLALAVLALVLFVDTRDLMAQVSATPAAPAAAITATADSAGSAN